MSAARALLAAGLAAGLLAAGCVSPKDIAAINARLAKMEAQQQLQAERVQSLQGRMDELAKLPKALDASVQAVMNYTRDVDKSISTLRNQTVSELDRQNAHIQKVKDSYRLVLEQELVAVGAMRKAIDSAFADLRSAIDASKNALQQALPSPNDTIPPVPPLPDGIQPKTKPDNDTLPPPPPPPPPPSTP